jgi:hypothetical protein
VKTLEGCLGDQKGIMTNVKDVIFERRTEDHKVMLRRFYLSMEDGCLFYNFFVRLSNQLSSDFKVIAKSDFEVIALRL